MESSVEAWEDLRAVLSFLCFVNREPFESFVEFVCAFFLLKRPPSPMIRRVFRLSLVLMQVGLYGRSFALRLEFAGNGLLRGEARARKTGFVRESRDRNGRNLNS